MSVIDQMRSPRDATHVRSTRTDKIVCVNNVRHHNVSISHLQTRRNIRKRDRKISRRTGWPRSIFRDALKRRTNVGKQTAVTLIGVRFDDTIVIDETVRIDVNALVGEEAAVHVNVHLL